MYIDNFSEFIKPLADVNKLVQSIDREKSIMDDMNMLVDGTPTTMWVKPNGKASASSSISGDIDVNLPRADRFALDALPNYKAYLQYAALYTTRPSSYSSYKESLLYPVANKDPQWRKSVLLPFMNIMRSYNNASALIVPVGDYPIISLHDYMRDITETPGLQVPPARLLDSRALCQVMGINQPSDDYNNFAAVVLVLWWFLTNRIIIVDVTQMNNYTMTVSQATTVTLEHHNFAMQYLLHTLPTDDFMLGAFCYPMYDNTSFFYHAPTGAGMQQSTVAYTEPTYNFVDHYLIHQPEVRYSKTAFANLLFNLRVLRLLCQQISKYIAGQGLIRNTMTTSYVDINVDPFASYNFASATNAHSLDYIPFEVIHYFGGSHEGFKKTYTVTQTPNAGYETQQLPVTTVATAGFSLDCCFLPKVTLAIQSLIGVGVSDVMMNYYTPSGRLQQQQFSGSRICRVLPSTFVIATVEDTKEKYAADVSGIKQQFVNWTQINRTVRPGENNGYFNHLNF